MNHQQILEDRIKTVTRRYLASLEDSVTRLNLEKERVVSGKIMSYEVGCLNSLNDVLKLNAELGELITLKDKIENQAR